MECRVYLDVSIQRKETSLRVILRVFQLVFEEYISPGKDRAQGDNALRGNFGSPRGTKLPRKE
jgi:hypothetical protein